MALYKRANSKYWWMKFTFDGELVQRSTQVKNKRDAETVESAYRTQLALGKIGIKPMPKAPTFEKAADDFLEWTKTTNTEVTQSRYYFACQPLKAFFGQTKTSKIDAATVEKYMSWRITQTSKRTGKAITRDSVNREIIILKKILRRLINNGILRDNSALSVPQLAGNDLTFHVITEKEEKAYLPACPQPLRDVAALMLESGMRPVEIFHLTKNDVHLDKNYLQVTRSKTKASIRRVPLSIEAKAILKARIKQFDGNLLFPQNDIDGSSPMNALDKPHRDVVNDLGFDFRLYDCRHTFATRALESGTDLLTLSAILGHANLKMVSRYAHPSEERKAEAIRRMQKPKQKQSKREK